MAEISTPALLRLLAEHVPRIARRSVDVPVKRFGTVTADQGDGATTVSVLIDGDSASVWIVNASGFPLRASQRALVDFYPPHGAVISGVLAASSSPALFDDWATWRHAVLGGGFDPTSGSFDYVADQTGSNGSSISVDSSVVWADPGTGVWGYPTPYVTTAGVYTVWGFIDPNIASAAQDMGLGFRFVDSTGTTIEPFNTGPDPQATMYSDGTHAGRVFLSLTVPLPANTHIDVQAVSVDPYEIDLTIQRIA